MGERQLRSQCVATRIEAAQLDSESFRDSKELECNVAGTETLRNKNLTSKLSCKLVMPESSQMTISLSTLRKQMKIFQ